MNALHVISRLLVEMGQQNPESHLGLTHKTPLGERGASCREREKCNIVSGGNGLETFFM